MSWLITFNVINVHNDLVRAIWNALNGITEPALRPIRRVLPNLGGLDVSPIVVFFMIQLLQIVVETRVAPLLRHLLG